MDIGVFPLPEVPAALAALRTIHPEPDGAQRQFLDVVARIHGVTLDDAPSPAAPDDTAAAIVDPHRRKRLLQLALITTMVDGRIEASELAAVDQLASAFSIDERAMRSLRHLARRHNRMARASLLRRIAGRFAAEAWHDEGWSGIRKMFGPFFGLGANPAVAAKYQALEHLPADSVGRAFWEHIRSNGFAFPGEKGGFPERGLFHDLGHVLAGYGTDPAGEIQQAAFQSGFMRNDGFAFLFFGIVQFHLGVKVTPIADPYVGLFDVTKVMTALARGAACTVDLSHRWDFWPLLPRPLDEVRAELGIPPLA
jgi:hypothetical protein